MKKNFLFISVLASLFIAGCSRDEIAPNEEDVGNGKANTSYIAVNLVSSDVTLPVTRMEKIMKTKLPKFVSISSPRTVPPLMSNFRAPLM